MGPQLTVLIKEVSLFQSVHNSRFDYKYIMHIITCTLYIYMYINIIHVQIYTYTHLQSSHTDITSMCTNTHIVIISYKLHNSTKTHFLLLLLLLLLL